MVSPRLRSSTRWVRFPPDLEKEVEAAFREIFQGLLKEHRWYVRGFFYPEEVIFSIGFGHPRELTHHHFHLSWESLEKESSPQMLEDIYLAADEIQKIILEFVDKASPDLPRHWQAWQPSGTEKLFFFCYSRENLDLEKQANELLGDMSWDQLTGGDWEPLIQEQNPSDKSKKTSKDEKS